MKHAKEDYGELPEGSPDPDDWDYTTFQIAMFVVIALTLALGIATCVFVIISKKGIKIKSKSYKKYSKDVKQNYNRKVWQEIQHD